MGLLKMIFYLACLFPLLGYGDPSAQRAHSQAVDIKVINQNGFSQSGSGTAFVRKTKDNKDIVFILTCVHVLMDSNITGERTFPKSLKVITPKGMTTIDSILLNNMGLKIGFDVAVLITTNNVEIFESAAIVDLADPPPVGEKIYAVGSPSGLGSIVIEGIISKRNCWLPAHQQFYDILSARVAGGFSGGGVYRRSDGKYAGMISMKHAEAGYGIMIPANQIITFLESTKQRYIVDLKHEVPPLKEILGTK
tara:strand:- start:2179 stop:2931 length:753 start_codon:yes stop_codon:yes gene_type:complete